MKKKDLREVVVTIKEIKIKMKTRKSFLKKIITDHPEEEMKLLISVIVVKMINPLKGITTIIEDNLKMMIDVNESISDTTLI